MRVLMTVLVAVRVHVRVADAVVLVPMEVERTAAPANDQTDREHGDDHADGRLCDPLHCRRQHRVQQHDRQAEDDERERVAEPPGPAQPGGRAPGALLRPGDEGRERDEVVGVARVPEPQQEREQEDDGDAGAVHRLLDSLT